MTAVEWLRLARQTRWWRHKSPTSFRLALYLLAMAEGNDTLVTTYARLSEISGLPKSSLHRALESLAEVGFCELSTSRGNGGETTITISPLGTLELSDSVVESAGKSTPLELSDNHQRNFENQISGTLELSESLCESPADPRDRGTLKIGFTELSGMESGQIASNSRARDQDLQKISDPDPSLDLSKDLQPPEIKQVLSGNSAADLGEPERAPRARIDGSKLSEKSWSAADYLRSRVLAENPAAVVGIKAWEFGWTWTSGAGVRIGDGSRNGLRLAWADKFRLLHQAVHKAQRNVNPKATAEETWVLIARAVHWLFHNQPEGGPRFRVECPDSIRAKWDRIQDSIKRWEMNGRQNGRRRGPDGRPDTAAPRQWKSADDWEKEK